MLNKAKKIAFSSALPLGALLLPASAMAQTFVPNELTSVSNVTNVVKNLIRFVLLIAFVLAFVFLIIGGLKWITAGGDEKAVGSARGTITAALIGLVVVLVSYALIVLIETFFNVSIISGNFTIPNITEN